MSKDPAFLFYSKEWLEGTAEMTSEEKGVYVDLLAHQHQKGSLPIETKKLAKLSGNSEKDFLLIWKELSTKFIPNGSGRLVNRKLNGIVTERFDRAWRNKIVGTLASVIKYSNNPYEINLQIKKKFRVEDFLSIPEQILTETITKWYLKWFESIANANEDANANNKINNGVGKFLVSDMMVVWVKELPTYTKNEEKDSLACRSIADFIFKSEGIAHGFGDKESEKKVIESFRIVAKEVGKDNFWKNKSLASISNHIQEFYNRIKNPVVNGTNKPSFNGSNKSSGAEELAENLHSKIIAGRGKND